MKAIILVSSIFYILGLKISNTFDVIKHPRAAVEKVIVHEVAPKKLEKTFDLTKSELANPVKDSVSGGGLTDNILELK